MLYFSVNMFMSLSDKEYNFDLLHVHKSNFAARKPDMTLFMWRKLKSTFKYCILLRTAEKENKCLDLFASSVQKCIFLYYVMCYDCKTPVTGCLNPPNKRSLMPVRVKFVCWSWQLP